MTPAVEGPMRSWLFVPGDSEKKLGKAVDIDADVLILDLEDSVPPAEKDTARLLGGEVRKHQGDRSAEHRTSKGVSANNLLRDLCVR